MGRVRGRRRSSVVGICSLLDHLAQHDCFAETSLSHQDGESAHCPVERQLGEGYEIGALFLRRAF